MKKIDLFVAAILTIGVLGLAGCAGTTYSTPIATQNGTLTVGGRTGVFGTDQGFALYEENKPLKPAPDKLVLQKAWSRQATIQEYDQKCPDPKQLKNIHTRTENVAESWQEEVPNPHKRAPQAQLIGGTNPSTGNLAVPALIQGGAMAGGMMGGAALLRPARTSVTQTGGGGTATTGSVSNQQDQVSNNANLNANQNANAADASSASSAASSAAAAAAAGN